METRRVLTGEEKARLRQQWPNCYICDEPLEGYDESEIEYDHIYDYASGYSQELSQFAPLHASPDPDKRNCHKAKGRKAPDVYKEELRIGKEVARITGLKDLCPRAKELPFAIDYDGRTITLESDRLPLYSQRIGGRDHWYFFCEIGKEYIETDQEIQLRPLDSRILGLTFHLKSSLQLLPSLGRLNTSEKKIRVFDGQHKAVAQLVGNRRDRIPCMVFVDPDVNELRATVTEAHTKFVQQRYAPSHIDTKLADIYAKRIKEFQGDDPNRPYSERDILRHEPKAKARAFLQASIIDGLRQITDFGFIANYVYVHRKEQLQKPIPWKGLQLFVQTFARLEPIDRVTGDPENFRGAELENLRLLLQLIEKHALRNKWQPNNPDAEEHKLARSHFFFHTLRVWVGILDEALCYALANLLNQPVRRPLCYRRAFTRDVEDRFDKIAERLFTHGLWHNPTNRATLQSSYAKDISDLFEKQGLHYVYLTRFD